MKYRVVLLLLVTMAFSTGPVAAAPTYFFPAGYEQYHTYAEVNAELDAAVATYGQRPERDPQALPDRPELRGAQHLGDQDQRPRGRR